MVKPMMIISVNITQQVFIGNIFWFNTNVCYVLPDYDTTDGEELKKYIKNRGPYWWTSKEILTKCMQKISQQLFKEECNNIVYQLLL